MRKHLRRLERVWIDQPIYFITTCAYRRRALFANAAASEILVEEWRNARERHGWAVGRYVIMPDHVHFFCRPEYNAKPLPLFIGAWKRYTSRRIHALERPGTASPATAPLWQAEFFDHVLRSGESYSEKWNYVRENPVRAGLVSLPDDWQFAGHVEQLML